MILMKARRCMRPREGNLIQIFLVSPINSASIFQKGHVRFGSNAAKRHVRFTPESGHVQCN